MLISMPTGTSTIFGVFQAMCFSQINPAKFLDQVSRRATRASFKGRSSVPVTQVVA